MRRTYKPIAGLKDWWNVFEGSLYLGSVMKGRRGWKNMSGDSDRIYHTREEAGESIPRKFFIRRVRRDG